MNDIFTKFYSNYIQDIHDFLDSNSDVLYISGFSGSGKSSVLKTALSSYKKDILNFHHLCFKNTVIDDFLLSFYDSFREHAIKQRIALKKNPEEGFMQKVNFYFKNLEYPAIVIIDNYRAFQGRFPFWLLFLCWLFYCLSICLRHIKGLLPPFFCRLNLQKGCLFRRINCLVR